MNILIIEDEVVVAQAIKNIFDRSSCTNIIHVAHSFQEAYDKAIHDIYDVILVDIVLGRDEYTGIDLCRIIRERNKEVVLICITGMKSTEYLEEAFRVGVNDYITKPFRAKEVELRVMRWRQLQSSVTVHDIIDYRGLKYDVDQNMFYFKDSPLNLTKKNKELLLLFLRYPEKILSQEFLRERLWGDYDCIEKGRNIRSNIQILKKYLDGHCSEWLKTVRGEGYLLQKE